MPFRTRQKQSTFVNQLHTSNTLPLTNASPMPSLRTTRMVISVRPYLSSPLIHLTTSQVWVNDYHLMLLPSLLRASPSFPAHVPIGFFLHVAFPSSEIFRC